MTLSANDRATSGALPDSTPEQRREYHDPRDIPGARCAQCGHLWQHHDTDNYHAEILTEGCSAIGPGQPVARAAFPDGQSMALWNPYTDTRAKNQKTLQTMTLYLDGRAQSSYTDNPDRVREAWEAAYRQITDQQR